MPGRILVVDDLVPNVRLLEARLSADYFGVLTASSGAEALEVARTQRPDLILLDVMMPGMDGFEVCKRLKADPATAHIPVVMVTALSETAQRVRGLESGADDFITKPPNAAALLGRVRSLVRLKLLADEWRERASTTLQFGAGGDADADLVQPPAAAKVLIADDRTPDIERAVQVLRGDGHDVTLAQDGAAALARAHRGACDLVVVSLLRSAGDGLRLCGQIRAEGGAMRRVPILVLIEAGDHETLVRAFDVGVNDYVGTPVDKSELLARARAQIRARRYQERLRETVQRSLTLSLTDALTGLHNRRFAEAHLSALVRRAGETHRPLAALMLDIDRFKAVNDSLGHAAGDEVLRAVANRVAQQLRGYDTATRWGGEEFLVLLPESDAAAAAAVGERLRASIASTPVAVAGAPDGELRVTVSVGGAVLGSDTDTPERLVAAADRALYAAKREGRNRVVVGDVPAPLAATG